MSKHRWDDYAPSFILWRLLRIRNRRCIHQLLAKWDRMDAEADAQWQPYEPTP